MLGGLRRSVAQGVAPAEREIVCIDGKATRGTKYENDRNPDIVSCHTGLTLATKLYEKKSNEIKSVPRFWTRLIFKAVL